MKKRWMSYALLGILAAGALTPVTALAQQTPPAQSQNATVTGTIAIPGGEAAELAQYQSLATVTFDEAIAAAQEATGLTDAPTKVELGNENGFLVWEVVIGDQEVKIDAGNGEVLQTEQVGAEDEADEGGEASQQEDGHEDGDSSEEGAEDGD